MVRLSSDEPPTLLSLLLARKSANADHPLYTFLKNGEMEGERLSARDLDARARAIAVLLRERGAAGQCALLLYPSGPEYLAALFGCIYAGVVAVPVAPPANEYQRRRLDTIAADAAVSFALTTLPLVDDLRGCFARSARLGSLRMIVTDTAPRSLATDWRQPFLRDDAPVLIQYPARSSGPPKGSLVTHAALLQSADAIQSAFQLGAGSISVTWLPGSHDMGLVDGLISPLYAGCHAIVMAPDAFLRKPVRWLSAISRYRATHSGGPSFAYEYCARRISGTERATLDLSSWSSAYTEAGPVRRDAMERFSSAFGPCGFQPRVLHPCYGRAMAMPAVARSRNADGPARALEISVGGRASSRRAPLRMAMDGKARPGLSLNPHAPGVASGPADRGLEKRETELPPPAFSASEAGLWADAILDTDIVPPARAAAAVVPSAAEAESILLTGATEILGARILHDLLENTTAQLYCLIKTPNVDDGARRIAQALRDQGIPPEPHADRIVPVPGDLTKPLMGLAASEYRKLSRRPDLIYHCASLHHWFFPYPALRSVNVHGTRELLRFAAAERAKPLHHVSSVSVFDGAPYAGQRVTESDDPDRCEGIYQGWSQSKWVAERLVAQARTRGLPVTIYRLPLLSGDSRNGRWDLDGFYCRLIKGCIQMGRMPDLDCLLDVAPVDFASRAIGYLSRQPGAAGRSYHLANPRPLHWADLRGWLERIGYDVAPCAYRDWTRLLGDQGRASANPLYPLMPLFLRRWSAEELTIPELSQQGKKARVDGPETAEALRGSEIACPPVDDALLKTYFDYFLTTGFLNAPRGTRS